MDPELEDTYLTLLGLAEKFRVEPYNNCLLSLKCLKAILNLPVEPEIHYSVYLKIGKILFYTFNDTDISKTYFEKAWYSSIIEIKYTAAIFLSKIYQIQGLYRESEKILNQCLNISTNNSLWYSIFVIELAQTYINVKDCKQALNCIERGLETAKLYHNEHTLFIYLSQALILILTNDGQKLDETIELINSFLKKIQHIIKKENLMLNTLLIQITSYLIQGKGKSVKPYLKKLQQILQSYNARNQEDDSGIEMVWLPKHYIILMAYMLIIVHALQVGYMERALKYIDKGLAQVESLKAEHNTLNDRSQYIDFSNNQLSPINLLSKFETAFREYSIVSHLVMGKYSSASTEIQRCFFHTSTNGSQVVRRDDKSHKIRLQLFLGLYCLSMKEYEKAQMHLNTVRLQPMNMGHDIQGSFTAAKRGMFCSFNLLLMYLHLNHGNLPVEGDIGRMLEILNPDHISESTPYIFRSAANFVYSLWYFCRRDFNEAKKYLREALKMSNAEDINRMTAFSLLLLGQIFIHSQNFQDCLTMLNPGCQLSVKIQDPCSQIWASVLYRQMYQATNNENQYRESLELSTNLEKTFTKEYQEAILMPQHQALINFR